MSLFAIGTFLAFITASNSAVTSTVIAPSISQQSDDWLNSMRGESANFEKQIVKKQISTLVNHQRQQIIKNIDVEVQKNTAQHLEKIKDSPKTVRAWNKHKSVLEKSIQKVKININGIELKFDDNMLVSPELFPAKIGSHIMGDAPLNKSRESYTQEMLSLEAQEIIEKEKKATLDEIEKRLNEDTQHEASKPLRPFLRIYKHDPDFIESQIEQIDKLSPGFKNSFKNLLFAKKESSQQDVTNIQNGLRIFSASTGMALDNSEDDFSEDEIIAHIDENKRINELQLEQLYANYPQFAELKKQIQYQQKLINIETEIFENRQDLIVLLESYHEEGAESIKDIEIIKTAREKRSLTIARGWSGSGGLVSGGLFDIAWTIVDLIEFLQEQNKQTKSKIQEETHKFTMTNEIIERDYSRENKIVKQQSTSNIKATRDFNFHLKTFRLVEKLCYATIKLALLLFLAWGLLTTTLLGIFLLVGAIFVVVVAALILGYHLASDDPNAHLDLSFESPKIQLI